MKILIADDDALIRRLLLALLNKLGHEVEVVEEGLSAMKALESATPPDVAVLDWVMPGLNGLEVCRKLRGRSTKSRTYVLLLSAKAEKSDIITGLDAGADDYLIKPFDPMALMARLRVAQRILAYQQELQRRLAEMEGLLQRHNLLGEIVGRQGLSKPSLAGDGGDENTANNSRRPASSGVPSVGLLGATPFNELLVRAFTEIGLGEAQAEVLDDNQRANADSFSAWTPLILMREGVWLDLLLEADDSSAVAKFEALLGRVPVSERELLDFLAETFNLLCTRLKLALAEQGSTVLMPIISRSMRSASLNVRPPAQAKISRHRLHLPGIALTVSAIRQPAVVVQKSFGQLCELDLLAENLPSPSAEEVFLLNQGVVLNQRYIEKLVSLSHGEKRDFRVPVIPPSALAQYFCLGRIS
jgi:CheY-like chemotaxis protein